MTYISRLITNRKLDRPVQKFAPDYVNAHGTSVEFLKNGGCESGDKFEVYEMRPVLVSTLVYMSDGTVDTYKDGELVPVVKAE